MSDELIILLGFMIGFLPFPIVFFFMYKINVIDKKEKIKKYTSEAPGIIIKSKYGGLRRPSVITVEYEVNNVKYKITETVKLKSKAIKIGFLPIGQIKKPCLENTGEGTQVTILHHPENPKRAIIKGNDGLFNI